MRKVGASVFKKDIDSGSEWLSPNFPVESPDFNQVEIQIVSWCNRTCDFCPSGTFEVPKQMMSMKAVNRIVDLLEPIGFSGTIGLHLMCEPLLHKKFGEIVSCFRRRLPQTYIRIESNGDMLDKDLSKLADFFDAGLNEVLINCYESKEQRDERNRRIMDLQRTIHGLWYHNYWMQKPYGPRHTWKYIRLRDFYDDGFSLRNWAGHVEMNRDDNIVFPLPMSCGRPFKRVHVNYLGQAILCNNDWKNEVVMGDLMTQSLDDVWNAPMFVEKYRPRLLEKSRDMKLCRSCDAGVPWTKEPSMSAADCLAGWRRRMLAARDRARSFLSALKRRLGTSQ